MPDPETDQDSLSDLQGELRYLLNRWDPIGIYDEELDFPPDEAAELMNEYAVMVSNHISSLLRTPASPRNR